MYVYIYVYIYKVHRGTSLISNTHPPRITNRALGMGSLRGDDSYERGTPDIRRPYGRQCHMDIGGGLWIR